MITREQIDETVTSLRRDLEYVGGALNHTCGNYELALKAFHILRAYGALVGMVDVARAAAQAIDPRREMPLDLTSDQAIEWIRERIGETT